MWASRGGDAISTGARDLYRSTIVGLNPARPVLRFVGRAGEIEREAGHNAQQRSIGALICAGF
ncbi:hypothetical protein [Hyphobacterium sp. CCMP332]|uniref:hypothetical protein n=1 Tax=Hyphobacterium sp. CCMP332 TaxID=2749086 RepID=UPI001F3C4472|nr:hypothetical protein [Hyphobacterium sp. CCMP332]